MSAQSIGSGSESTDEIRYQITSVDRMIKLDLSKDNQELALSTDPESALQLASDILAAVNHSAGMKGPE